MRKIFIFFVRAYRIAISPMLKGLGGGCRFYPSCSEYALDAYLKKTWWRATAMTISRFIRCHPFSTGGYDPVR